MARYDPMSNREDVLHRHGTRAVLSEQRRVRLGHAIGEALQEDNEFMVDARRVRVVCGEEPPRSLDSLHLSNEENDGQ